MRRALLVLSTLACLMGTAHAQISPGPLSAAHEELDGMRNCRSCHGGGDEELDHKCLDCHQALAWTIEAGKGLHAREGRSECAQCHPEHAGRDFELVDWGGSRDDFDHGRTGYALQGAHATLDCEKCHQEKNRHRNVTLRRPGGSGADTWLGLDASSCQGCHQSPHSARIGSDCTGCHNDRRWTDVANFDHARTAWALTGRHAKLECKSCHANGKFGTTASSPQGMHYAPIEFSECSSCHKDPHTGRFGPQCSSCHVTSTFKEVPKGRFEHARTRFPLKGAHAKVSCERCHDPAAGGWGARPAFEACSSCHRDAHAGTATLAGAVVDCDQCHTEQDFKETTFDLSRHAKSDYPLAGRHETVACRSCHRHDPENPAFGTAGVDLRPKFGACADCHADAHAGQFARREDGGRCETCHVVDGFKPSTFGPTAHAASGFALLGAHATAECRSCHAPARPWEPATAQLPDPGKANVVLARPERACADCHLDVHRARYAKRSCADCHDQRRFAPSAVGLAEHAGFEFRLDGAHRATPCVFCHKELDSRSHLPDGTHALIGELSPPEVVLWELSSACQSCHETEVSQ